MKKETKDIKTSILNIEHNVSDSFNTISFQLNKAKGKIE
jgi:hypothetical protein